MRKSHKANGQQGNGESFNATCQNHFGLEEGYKYSCIQSWKKPQKQRCLTQILWSRKLNQDPQLWAESSSPLSNSMPGPFRHHVENQVQVCVSSE